MIEPVTHSEWAAPIVPVLKRDGTVRICGDYKLTVNRAAKAEIYPLPRIEDLLAQLSWGWSTLYTVRYEPGISAVVVRGGFKATGHHHHP